MVPTACFLLKMVSTAFTVLLRGHTKQNQALFMGNTYRNFLKEQNLNMFKVINSSLLIEDCVYING